ncbi:MAG: hypothetical protein JST09_16625 [Bacteroidetes bacterium]|nr:hypothetical protein [Bacteroidota bacterium]MBS1609424.1 hypothetical protein [Bacteroidota bacterium]
MIAKYFYLIFLFTACHKNPVDNNLSNYFPNNVGNTWEYDVADSTLSSPGNPSTPQHYAVKVSIIGIKKLADGQDAAIWVYKFPSGNDTNYVRQTGDTIKTFYNQYSTTVEDLNFPAVIFIPPFTINQRWNGKLYGVDSFRVVRQTTINTPNHTFDDCFDIYLHYLGPNTELNDHYYIKPFVGITRKELIHYMNGPILYQTWTLKTYIVH